MKDAWLKLAGKFNALKPRERMLVFIAGAVIIGWLGFVGVIEGTLAKQKLLATAVEKKRTALSQLQTQSAELRKSLAQDPDAGGRRRIEELRQDLGEYDAELRGVQQGLVPPERMVRLLERVLAGNSRIRLVKLHTLPVTALVEPAAEAGAAGEPAAEKKLVYKHGIELTVEGSYLDLLDYQAKLEKLPWQMFFARTSIDSSGYPRVQMTVTLYTLSLEETWLVV